MGVAAENLVRLATYSINAQYGLNLVSVQANAVGESYVSPMHNGMCHLAETSHHYQETWQA